MSGPSWRRLLPQFQPGILVIADRGFFSYEPWRSAAATSADLLWRVSMNVRLPVLAQLPRRLVPICPRVADLPAS